MKKIFFCCIIPTMLVFSSCRKPNDKPKNNALVTQYPNGTTISTGVPGSSINGNSIDVFYIRANGRRKCNSFELLPSNFDFSINVTQGVPPQIIFDSSGKNQGIEMKLYDSFGITWRATKGTAYIDLDYDNPNTCPYSGKVTFTDVAFTNTPISQDTLWVSGNVNAYY